MTGPGPESAPPPEQPASPPPASPPPAGPPPAGPPPGAAASGMPAWTSQLTSTQPVAGPAGLYYADVPNRIIAYIIDAIIIFIVGVIISIVIYAILGPATSLKEVQDPNSILGVRFETQTNILSALVFAVFNIAWSGGYFVYMWTAMRGTVGMKLLGMQVGNAADGATLSMEQAIRRWLALGGVFALAQALNPLPLLGILLGLASLIWVIALLVTTAQSPTKQGLHDQFAGTIVVKAARALG
jgi:uncharacterized RDD family membrane protein YckC